MELKDILAISGKPGLYKTIAQTKNGVIIESLADGKRSQAFAADKISSLSEISIFTTGDDKPLREVLQQMQSQEATLPLPGAKADDAALKKYFLAVVPDFDAERVYVSHIRKIVAWYGQLTAAGMTDFSEKEEDSSSPGEANGTDKA